MAVKNTSILFIMLLTIVLSSSLSCGPSGPRDRERARRAAVAYFEDAIVYEEHIDENLFRGPDFDREDEEFFYFHWMCLFPRPGESIIEVIVPRNPKRPCGYRSLGPRGWGYLRYTRELPINEAVLRKLFYLPLNSRETSTEDKTLRNVLLDTNQIMDMANFLAIRGRLAEYSICFNGRYPDSLSQLKDYSRGNCMVHEPDSVYMHDRYGRKYIYENLINYVVLGSQGANGQWDFELAVVDSIYNDNRKHINVNGDDIIVKFKPRP